ncbi:hypothetical protein ASN18_2768 [Candidatus Magnetominusculus xianensis]|uniref:Uncharacterized protein n=1 Tax=Candidatus Magnetominusculus xianensis TaxID=1748249 RepID=A0ABR5SC49_9BACT|nr:hypothetical protein ASN18_2768 [Candidatus Magnetominusculus xianensis]
MLKVKSNAEDLSNMEKFEDGRAMSVLFIREHKSPDMALIWQ